MVNKTYLEMSTEEVIELMKSRTTSSVTSNTIVKSEKTTGIEILSMSPKCDLRTTVDMLSTYTLLTGSTILSKIEKGRIFKGAGIMQNASLTTNKMVALVFELEALGIKAIQVYVKP